MQNDRLPARCVVQVLFLSEHGCGKLGGHHRLAEWTAAGCSFRDLQSGRSPAPAGGLDDVPSAAVGTAAGARCPSKREVVAAQHHELRRLREDVARLQVRRAPTAVERTSSRVGCLVAIGVSVTRGADEWILVRAGAVPRAAGAGGPAELGEPAAARAARLGRGAPVPRRRGRVEQGGRLRQRRGQDAARREQAGTPPRADAGHLHAADGVEVAQVALLKGHHGAASG